MSQIISLPVWINQKQLQCQFLHFVVAPSVTSQFHHNPADHRHLNTQEQRLQQNHSSLSLYAKPETALRSSLIDKIILFGFSKCDVHPDVNFFCSRRASAKRKRHGIHSCNLRSDDSWATNLFQKDPYKLMNRLAALGTLDLTTSLGLPIVLHAQGA